MAHAVKLSSLTDELVTLLTGISSKGGSSRFNAYRESALRTLRSNSYPRTNHFDIQHHLEGLEEKFRVYNEDDLADALHERLDELALQSMKFTSEILHLLLELSDKPVEKSKVHSLDFMKLQDISPSPRYTWEQLAIEDPLSRDGDIWQTIDYAAESSDDEVPSLGSEMDEPSLSEISTASSIDDCRPISTDELATSAKSEILCGLEEAQFWRRKIGSKIHSNPVLLTELQVIREVLFLLSGLPTSLFLIRNPDMPLSSGMNYNSQPANYPRSPSTFLGEGGIESSIATSPGYAMKHTSPQMLHAVLARFAKESASILSLREWAKSKETVPLLQGLQYEAMARIQHIDDKLSDTQARLLAPSTSLTISLIGLQFEVASMTRPLIKLSGIIRDILAEPYAHSFRCLELLYAEICTSQMVGDDELYKYLGTVFFDCFLIYLRPIKTWMEEGEIGKDDNFFFISEVSKDLELESLWLDRFRLRKTSNGTLHAPGFLHPVAHRIFTTGKSVVVLKQLGKYDRVRRPRLEKEKLLNFQEVCGSCPKSLAPFPELFEAAFDRWVKSKHCVTSSTLRECLFDECGLRTSLSAMEKLYFMVDGAVTTSLASAIFQRLDSGKTTWNDRYVLTELVQSTIGSLPGVVAERLRTKISRHSQTDVSKSRMSVRSLGSISFTYSLPWPVQIIVTKDTISQYQKVFTFLLQIRRSSDKLQSIQREEYTRTDEQALYYGLRSCLLWFTSTLYGYLTDLVISTNLLQMRKALSDADDIDGMIAAHRNHMKRMIDQALLSSRLEPIQKSIMTILDLSIHLSDARIMQTSARDPRQGNTASINGTPTSHLSSRRAGSLGQHRLTERNPGLSENEASDDEVEQVNAAAEVLELSFEDRMRQLQDQFDSLCKFVVIGLRGVARAGGEPNWDMLADKLGSASRVI